MHTLNNVEHVTQVPLYVNPTKEDIIIAGGVTSGPIRTSSVEKFSWKERAWAQLPPMKECRSEPSSFVYNNQIFVAGGYTDSGGYGGSTDTIETLKIDEQPLKWTESPAKLSFKCNAHKTVVYQNSLIHIGGYNATEKSTLTPFLKFFLLHLVPRSCYAECHNQECTMVWRFLTRF